jgi:hypothetical protein
MKTYVGYLRQMNQHSDLYTSFPWVSFFATPVDELSDTSLPAVIII